MGGNPNRGREKSSREEKRGNLPLLLRGGGKKMKRIKGDHTYPGRESLVVRKKGESFLFSRPRSGF